MKLRLPPAPNGCSAAGPVFYEEYYHDNCRRTKTITVNFERKQYDLTVNTEGKGTVEESILNIPTASTYQSETQLLVTARPDSNWEFVQWRGALNSTVNPDTHFMSGHTSPPGGAPLMEYRFERHAHLFGKTIIITSSIIIIGSFMYKYAFTCYITVRPKHRANDVPQHNLAIFKKSNRPWEINGNRHPG